MKKRLNLTIVAIVGAAALAAGGGATAFASPSTAAATARASTATSTSFTWHPLHLLNGWGVLSSKFYGTPSYAIKDGVLYLSGIVSATSASRTRGPEVAVLPAGARPRHYLWLSYMNFGSGGTVPGTMEIEPNGEVFLYGQAVDPSLQGISFPLSS